MKRLVMVVLSFLSIATVLSVSPAAAKAYLPKECRGYSGSMLCASKAQARVIMVQNGQVVRSGRARFGGVASDGTGPFYTRIGIHTVGYKSKNEKSTDYGVYMPFFVQFSGGEGIHYSREFAQTGYAYSHGCVGLSNYKFARKVYNFAYPGMVVVVTSG